MCDVPDPKTSIYMDDVGLSLSDIEAFVTKPYSNAKDYFTSRFNQAVREVENLVYNYFQGRYLATSLVDSHRLGVYTGTQSVVAGSNFMGIQTEFLQCESFLKVGIAEISLLINSTQNVDVKIYDLRQNKLLHTLTLACVAGRISTEYLHKEFKSDKQPLNLIIGYDAAGINSFRTPIKQGLCCGRNYCANSYMTARGVSASSPFYDSATSGIDHTGGLSVVYSIGCDHRSWICSHATSLALPIAFKAAEIMVSDALFNTSGERSTNHHTVNIDELEKRHGYYTTKFESIISSLLGNMQLPKNKCFYCDTPLRHKIILP